MSSPPVTPGFVDREPEGSLTRRITGVFIAVPAGTAFLSLFIGLGKAIVVGVIVLVCFALIARDSLRAALGWSRPIIQISTQGYSLGSTPTITYRRKPKRVIDISACHVTCRLVCQERATYTDGSDTTTVSRDVFESVSRSEGEGSAEGLVAAIELDIGTHRGAPSFKLPNNEVRWLAEIRISGPRLPKDSHTFVVDVAPRLDERYRLQVQDS